MFTKHLRFIEDLTVKVGSSVTFAEVEKLQIFQNSYVGFKCRLFFFTKTWVMIDDICIHKNTA